MFAMIGGQAVLLCWDVLEISGRDKRPLTTMDTTAHDLKILSICYYIHAGIVGCSSLFILGYAAFVGTLIETIQQNQASGREVPPWLGPLLATILIVVFFLAAGMALCQFLTGRWLTRHKHKLFCEIIAGITCLAIPYGTTLGVFTFLVLGRPEAKRLFAGAQPVWTPPAPPPISGAQV
jgi:hypothetical protein